MSRMSLFNSPFLLGFDHFERTVDRISKLSSDSYPPYNIEQTSTNTIRITIAVAGFEKKDLDISLEGNQLQIRGNKQENDSEKIYIHRGIATRQFLSIDLSKFCLHLKIVQRNSSRVDPKFSTILKYKPFASSIA